MDFGENAPWLAEETCQVLLLISNIREIQMSVVNYHDHKEPKKTSKPGRINWAVVGCAVVIVPFVIFLIYLSIDLGHQFFRTPAEKQIDLENEFKTIAPLQGAKLVSYEADNKPVQASVSARYSTDVDTEDIFKHYDEQLNQHGWRLIEKKTVTVGGNDLGGKSALYCKGENAAEIYYAGQQITDGWTYEFSMSWGIRNCEANQK
jgi:hypothetical protein